MAFISDSYSSSVFFLTGFMIVMYVFETYLDLRQLTALKLPTLPKTLVGVISQEKFEKSRAYSLDKRFLLNLIYKLCYFPIILGLLTLRMFIFYSYFHFVHEFVTILMDSAILFFGILPWFWKVHIWFQYIVSPSYNRVDILQS